MKANLLHGIIAGILPVVAAIVFLNIYQELYFVDFSLIKKLHQLLALPLSELY